MYILQPEKENNENNFRKMSTSGYLCTERLSITFIMFFLVYVEPV
jgi:hypothetical protein